MVNRSHMVNRRHMVKYSSSHTAVIFIIFPSDQPLYHLSVTKLVRCPFYQRKMMQLAILSSNPYLPVIPGFVTYLIKGNALNNLTGKLLGILSFLSATKKR